MIFLKFFILGVLTALLYPPFFMLPLGFALFPYFIFLISKVSYQKSSLTFFISGSLFGFGFLITYLSWIHNPFMVYETTKPYAILALLLPIFLSIFFGLVFILYKYFNAQLLRILVTPFIFILIELIISNFIYGFPWVSNSLILSNNIFGFYLIKHFGIITSGYLILLIFLLTNLLFYYPKTKKFYKLVFLTYSPLIFIIVFPIISNLSNNNSLGKEITIEAHQILNPINSINKNNIEDNIINIINNSNSDYIVFAENNFPYLIYKDNLSNLSDLIKKNKKIIIGGTTYKDENYYNSFLLLEKDKVHFFDKKILVPFGEFLPFRKYLNFMEIISGNVDFNKGSIDRIIVTSDNLKILPIICYEIIFDKIFNNINKKEIDILINITNDSWFGTKTGPYQHFYITRIKSLVANKSLLRVSNNGISAIIDNNGKIIKSTKLNQKTNINYKLNINNNKSYLYVHKLFTYYLFLIFILLLIFSKRKVNEN